MPVTGLPAYIQHNERRDIMNERNKAYRWIAGIIGLALVVTAGICIFADAQVNAAPQKELFEIKTWTRKDCSVTPWYVTDKLGYFAEEGIKLKLTGETQAPLQIPSILKGNNDVGTAHPNQLAVAKAGGAKLTGVVQGGIEPTDPKIPDKFRHMWWYVNPTKTPNVKSFADLKNLPGKIKVATITRNICADFETNLLADKYGIPRDKFEWVAMPDVQAIQALKQGLIHLSIPHPPFYKGMADAGMRKIADTFETGLGASAGITYYYFRDEYIKQHPDKVAAFSRAVIKGQKWANANPEKSAKMTEEAIGVPVTGNHYYSTVIPIDEKLSARWIQDLEDNKVIPKGKVTPSNLITHDIEKINLKYEAEKNKNKKGSKKLV
jgi:ABC-type nitrate/sulfonate/bicarbonate transport system substrate-binding protein